MRPLWADRTGGSGFALRTGRACGSRLALRAWSTLRPLRPGLASRTGLARRAVEGAGVGVLPDAPGQGLRRVRRGSRRLGRCQQLVQNGGGLFPRLHAGGLRSPADRARLGIDRGDHHGAGAVGAIDADLQRLPREAQHLRRDGAGVPGQGLVHGPLPRPEDGDLRQALPVGGKAEADRQPHAACGQRIVHGADGVVSVHA